tara:strand:- start:12876 stop:13400 length:525 start_codon:yes stop_codon:yes gene_type:complete
MKKAILILILVIGFTAQAQEKNSHNLTFISAAGTYIDLGDWIQPNYSDDGFNYGVQYDFQMRIPYVGAEILLFPDLNEINYTHIILRAGAGYEIGNPVGVKWRGNIGFRGGRIFRAGYDGPYALIGLEVGVQMSLPFGLIGKLIYARDTKSDAAIWHKDSHTVNSVFVGVGVRF